MIDLLTEHQPRIAELCRRYGVRKLDVFGSAAFGTFDPETSDVDFIVDLGDLSQGSTWRYFDFANALEGLLGRSVDLITEGSIRNPYFRVEVNETRQPLFSESGSTAPILELQPRRRLDADLLTQRRLAQHLWTAQQSARSLKSFVRNRTLDDYVNDRMLRAGVERELQILGAALGRVRRADETIAARIPTIPVWVALQERIDLTYENINAKRMWSILSRHLDWVVDDLDVVMRDVPPAEGAEAYEEG